VQGTVCDCLENDVSRGTWHDDVGGGGGDLALEAGTKWSEGYIGFIIPWLPPWAELTAVSCVVRVIWLWLALSSVFSVDVPNFRLFLTEIAENLGATFALSGFCVLFVFVVLNFLFSTGVSCIWELKKVKIVSGLVRRYLIAYVKGNTKGVVSGYRNLS
jgi:hypothetical protein